MFELSSTAYFLALSVWILILTDITIRIQNHISFNLKVGKVLSTFSKYYQTERESDNQILNKIQNSNCFFNISEFENIIPCMNELVSTDFLKGYRMIYYNSDSHNLLSYLKEIFTDDCEEILLNLDCECMFGIVIIVNKEFYLNDDWHTMDRFFSKKNLRFVVLCNNDLSHQLHHHAFNFY